MNRLISWCCFSALNVVATNWVAANTVIREYAPITVVGQPQEFRQFEKVEITGSSIVRKEQTRALPVQVITQEDIRRSGLQSITDVVQSLPLMYGFTNASLVGMVIGGYSSAAIRGMRNQTLVLVNGLRLAPFGLTPISGPERSGVDLSTLPLATVERIEVLSDGASSLYGTDAIAGVVNIILRNERKGLEISANTTRPYGGAGTGWTSNFGWGTGDIHKDGYNLMVSAEASANHELLGKDRPYASNNVRAFEWKGEKYWPLNNFTNIYTSPPGLVQLPSANKPNGAFSNHLYQNGQCDAESLPLLPLMGPIEHVSGCLLNSYPRLGIYPAQEKMNLYIKGERVLGGNARVFADWLIGRNVMVKSIRNWSWAESAYGLLPNSVGYEQALKAGLDPQKTALFWMPELAALRQASAQTNSRISAGVSGQWQDWFFRSRAYLSQSQAKTQYDAFGELDYSGLGLGNKQVWTNASVMQPLDQSNPLTGQLLSLRGGLKDAEIGTNRFTGVQATGSRSLMELNGHDVSLALGAEVRQERTTYENLAPELQLQSPTFSNSRQLTAGFAELLIPVQPNWEVNTSVRADHYSDLGSTFNGKVFSRWAITPQWSMRGSVGTGFRAPVVAQTKELENPFVVGQSIVPVPCDDSRKAIAQRLGGNCSLSNLFNPYILSNGNADLKPEKSTQLTWGLAFMPQRNLRIAVDAWALRVQDRIKPFDLGLVLNNPLAYEANYLLRKDLLAIYLPMQNEGAITRSGLDFEGAFRHPGHWGRWSIGAKATYILKSEIFNEVLGKTSDRGISSPRMRAQIIGTLERDKWTNTVTINYNGKYSGNANPAWRQSDGDLTNVARDVEAFYTLDANVSYRPRPDVDFRFGVQNAFNKAAPLSFVDNSSAQAYGIDTRLHSAWGRTWRIGLNLRF